MGSFQLNYCIAIDITDDVICQVPRYKGQFIAAACVSNHSICPINRTGYHTTWDLNHSYHPHEFRL
jgi:hypothetical protein